MILKLMDRDNTMMDDHPMKGCRHIEGVQETRFEVRSNGESALHVQYRAPNRGLDAETFVLNANAYLMNDSGKTIQTFSPTNLE